MAETALRKRVKVRLKKMGKSQVWLAREAGMTPQALGRVLSRGNPRLTTLERLADAMGIRVGRLVNGEPKKKRRGKV